MFGEDFHYRALMRASVNAVVLDDAGDADDADEC
jgi:hypothetical protein